MLNTLGMQERVTFAFIVILIVGLPGVGIAQEPFTVAAKAAGAEFIATGAETAGAHRAMVPIASTVQREATSSDMRVWVYPVFVWVPAFSATTTVPAFPDVPNGPDLPGGSGSTSASLNGAFLAGLSIEKSRWRIDADGVWAAVASQVDRPLLRVDLDVIYGHAGAGVKLYKDLYVTGGVRRLALKYDIQLGDRAQHFIRKPGIWDPLVGLGWHGSLGSRWTLHLTGDGGGFGAGADVDLAGTVRADVKLPAHVGLTFGYTALYLKISDTVLQRTFAVKQTLHGPVVGLGLYF